MYLLHSICDEIYKIENKFLSMQMHRHTSEDIPDVVNILKLLIFQVLQNNRKYKVIKY